MHILSVFECITDSSSVTLQAPWRGKFEQQSCGSWCAGFVEMFK